MAQQSFDSLVDDEDTYGGLSGEAKAFGAGAARSASFGLSDQALVRSGLVNPETLKGLQTVNPLSSATGEIAGVIAPMALGDEAGLLNLPGSVAKLGGIAEGSAGLMGAGNATAKAIGYGLEGAAYGGGQSISENALGDHDLLSEKTLANIGLSAAFSGGLGALVGKFGPQADKSSSESKFLAKKIESSAEPGSAEAVISQTDLPAEDKLSFIQMAKKQKAGANAMRKEFQEAGLPEVLGMMSDNQMVQKYASAISQLPTMAGEAVRKDVDAGFNQVNGIIKDAFNVMPQELMDRESGGATIKDLIRDKFDQMQEPLKALYKEREAQGNIIRLPDEEVLKFYDSLNKEASQFKNVTNEGRKIISQSANEMLQEAAHQAESSGTSAISNLDAYSKSLAQKARAATRSGDHDVAQAYYLVRDKIENFIDEQMIASEKELGGNGAGAGAGAEEVISNYKDLKEQYKNFKGILSDFAETTGLGKRATTEMGLNEALDKIPNEKFVDKIFDPKNAQGLRNIKENFPDVFQALSAQKKSQMYQDALVNKTFNPLQLLKDVNTDKKMSKGVRDLLFSPEELNKMGTAEKWIRNLPAKVGPSGTPEGLEYMEMAKNPIKSLIGHGVNEAGSSVGKKLIESLTKPEEEAQLKTLLNLNKTQEKINNGIMLKINEIFNKSKEPLAIKGISKLVSMEDFDNEAEKIRSDANNPQSTLNKFASVGALDLHAPNVSNSMKMAYARGVQFLNSKLPPQPTDFLGKRSPIAKAEISKFNRYYRIVQNPLSALEQVKNGTIVPETTETLTNVYPRLFMDMKQKLLHQISEQTSVPYQTRQSISMFLGEPLDKALSPQAILANQSTIAFAPKNQGLNAPQGKMRTKGLDKMDRPGRLAADYGALSDKV